jgi:hypothetical protein
MKAYEILTEGLKREKAEDILHSFIKFAQKELRLKSLPEIKLQQDSNHSVEFRSFGGYGNQNINLSIVNRHIMDVCRTLAHELVHYRQDINNELDGSDPGATGSPQENEANAQAAVIMRKWGKLHPELFSEMAVE